MSIYIAPTPETLLQDAERAKHDLTPVSGIRISAILKLIAEEWHKDQEKIKYLESLLLRK